MTIEDIVMIAAHHLDVNMKVVYARTRSRKAIKLRHVTFWLANEAGPHPCTEIARVTRYNAACVRSGVRNVLTRRASDPAFRQETDELLAKVRAHGAN